MLIRSLYCSYFAWIWISIVSLCLVHTADTDKTRQNCFVLSCRRPRCELNWRQVKTVGDWKFRNSFVQNSKCGVNWVLSCPGPVSNSHATWLPIVTSYLETGSRLVHKCVHTADKTAGQNCMFDLQYIENCLQLSRTQFIPPTRQHKSLLFSVSAWRVNQPYYINFDPHTVIYIPVGIYFRHITDVNRVCYKTELYASRALV